MKKGTGKRKNLEQKKRVRTIALEQGQRYIPYVSLDHLLNVFRPIRIGPGALLAHMPSPRTWSNFPTGPKAPCVILGLCPYNSPSKFRVFPLIRGENAGF